MHAPLRGNHVSALTLRVIQWWIEVLQVEAIEWHCMRIQRPLCNSQSASGSPLCDRNVVISWSDAASSSKFLSAVFFDGEKFEYTRMVAPSDILDNMLQRNDGMVGVVGLLAVLLVLETCKDTFQHSRLQAYIDNDGVFYSIINASCKAPDINLIVCKFWKSLHSPSIDVTAFRSESKAKI